MVRSGRLLYHKRATGLDVWPSFLPTSPRPPAEIFMKAYLSWDLILLETGGLNLHVTKPASRAKLGSTKHHNQLMNRMHMAKYFLDPLRNSLTECVKPKASDISQRKTQYFSENKTF